MNDIALFKEMVDDLTEAGLVERLVMFKIQFENDIARIGNDIRLQDKLDIVLQAIKKIQ